MPLPSVFATARLTCGTIESASVAELLPGVGSVTPAGAVTVAVLISVPEAAAESVAVSVKVTLAPAGRLTLALMLPDPDAGQVPPPAPTQVHAAPVSTAGTVSVTVPPVTPLGPALLATIVYVTGLPGTAVADPSVFVIERSAVGVVASVSLAELLPGVGSVVPAGTATVAVLTSMPVAAADSVAVSVYVTLAPAGRLTVSAMLPLPDAVHVPPPAPTQVHVAPVSAAGSVSITVAPLTALGPAFDATIVYVTGLPGTTLATPSVFVIERSAVGVVASVSVAELFPGVGSVTPAGAATVAALTSVPVAAADSVAVSVYVALAPAGRLTVSAMLPLPDAVHVPPPAPAHVQLTPESEAGSVSATVAPVTALGPALLATIVYVTTEPGTTVATPSVFVIARSADGAIASVSVAELFVGVGSLIPTGAVTVAVLTSVPVAAAERVAVSV